MTIRSPLAPPPGTASHVSLEALSAGWRGAFDVADRALDAAGDQLAADDLAERRARLKRERAATARLLRSLASLHGDRDGFVPLMLPRSRIKSLLGLPPDIGACIFNLDGVLIGSAAVHAAAWSETFDEFIHARVERTHGGFAPFNPRVDYSLYMHARPRLEGVRAFLASRGIRLLEGEPGDPAGTETVHGLANRKKQALLRYIETHGLTAFEGARRYLELAREVGIRTAVVSASANARTMLDSAGLTELIDCIVDGDTIVADRLRTKPAPDALLGAAARLGLDAGRIAVFETSPAGVEAAVTGAFQFVVAVGRGDQAAALSAAAPDEIVADLAELLQRRLSAAIPEAA